MVETFSVTYERKLSDGNYGSEGVSMTLSMVAQDGEAVEEWLTDDTAERLYEKVRECVLTQLSHSEAPRVAAVASAELTGKLGRAWGESNAVAEEHAIRHMDDDVNLEELPF